jgi:phospholipid/cholesterol/gamma-HCH transport system substrate-binding protein
MKSFSKRNPIPIGLISIAVIAVLLTLAYRADSLPVIGSGPEYKAQFSEAAGLSPGDEVRIAGVKVGKVTKVGLDHGHVLVVFRTKDADIGNASSASIQIKTLLGDKFLAIDPEGDKPLAPGDEIPLERTLAPYDVVQAFNQLSDTVGELDTTQLANGLRTLSDTFKDTPKEVRASLDGLSRLSVTIASRNTQLSHLLGNTNKASGLLAGRNDDITAILSDGTKLLDELRAREDSIDKLLDGSIKLSNQLQGLVKDNEDEIGPTLSDLDKVTRNLKKHRDDLADGLRRLGPFVTVFTNSLGNGRWFDSFVAGLLPATPLSAGATPSTLPALPVSAPPLPVVGGGR